MRHVMCSKYSGVRTLRGASAAHAAVDNGWDAVLCRVSQLGGLMKAYVRIEAAVATVCVHKPSLGVRPRAAVMFAICKQSLRAKTAEGVIACTLLVVGFCDSGCISWWLCRLVRKASRAQRRLEGFCKQRPVSSGDSREERMTLSRHQVRSGANAQNILLAMLLGHGGREGGRDWNRDTDSMPPRLLPYTASRDDMYHIDTLNSFGGTFASQAPKPAPLASCTTTIQRPLFAIGDPDHPYDKSSISSSNVWSPFSMSPRSSPRRIGRESSLMLRHWQLSFSTA